MRNLVRLFEKAEHKDRDLTWYYRANQTCKHLAEKYGFSLTVVCGVISALSPSCHWERNVKEAEGMMSGKEIPFTTYGLNVSKARKILKGDVEPHKAFNERTGTKTYNFFYNLLDPFDDYHVTIDRHSFAVATGEQYNSIHYQLYCRIADHYRRSAEKLGLIPSQLQAVLWVDYRESRIVKPQNVPF